MFQGLDCSPIKMVRELGSEHHETVWSISDVGVRALRGPFPNTKGQEGHTFVNVNNVNINKFNIYICMYIYIFFNILIFFIF